MSSHSRSNLSRHEREEFLRGRGYVPVRSGKGSHEIWNHSQLQSLARKYKVAIPDNIKSTPHQKAWEMVLCADPGPGTWIKIEKQCEWAQKTVRDLLQGEEKRSLSRQLKHEFKKALRDVHNWRREIGLACKAGLDRALMPEPPQAVQQVNDIRARLSFS